MPAPVAAGPRPSPRRLLVGRSPSSSPPCRPPPAAAASRPRRLPPAGRRAGRRPVPPAGAPVRPRQPRASSTAPTRAPTVRAAADGRVTFAGSVAGTPPRHGPATPTGCAPRARSSTTVDVVVGQQRRARATVLGTTGGPPALQRPARRRLLRPRRRCSARARRGCASCRSTSRPATGAAGERSAIRQLLGGVGGAALGVAGGAGRARSASWLRDGGDAAAAHAWPTTAAASRSAALRARRCSCDDRRRRWQRAREIADRPCTAADVRRRRRRRAAASRCSSPASAPPASTAADRRRRRGALGYDAADVAALQLRGRAHARPDRPRSPAIDAAPVRRGRHPAATSAPAARRLADLVEAGGGRGARACRST